MFSDKQIDALIKIISNSIIFVLLISLNIYVFGLNNEISLAIAFAVITITILSEISVEVRYSNEILKEIWKRR